jgi:hypothetical protein
VKRQVENGLIVTARKNGKMKQDQLKWEKYNVFSAETAVTGLAKNLI